VYGLSVLMAFIEELRPVRRPPAFKSIPMVVGYVLLVDVLTLWKDRWNYLLPVDTSTKST